MYLCCKYLDKLIQDRTNTTFSYIIWIKRCIYVASIWTNSLRTEPTPHLPTSFGSCDVCMLQASGRTHLGRNQHHIYIHHLDQAMYLCCKHLEELTQAGTNTTSSYIIWIKRCFYAASIWTNSLRTEPTPHLHTSFGSSNVSLLQVSGRTHLEQNQHHIFLHHLDQAMYLCCKYLDELTQDRTSTTSSYMIWLDIG